MQARERIRRDVVTLAPDAPRHIARTFRRLRISRARSFGLIITRICSSGTTKIGGFASRTREKDAGAGQMLKLCVRQTRDRAILCLCGWRRIQP